MVYLSSGANYSINHTRTGSPRACRLKGTIRSQDVYFQWCVGQMPPAKKGLPKSVRLCRKKDNAQNGKGELVLAQTVTQTGKIPYRGGPQMPGIFNRNRVVYLDNGGGGPVSA